MGKMFESFYPRNPLCYVGMEMYFVRKVRNDLAEENPEKGLGKSLMREHKYEQINTSNINFYIYSIEN